MTYKEQKRLLERLHDAYLKKLYDRHKQNDCEPGCCYCAECPGHDRGGKAPRCCDRAGEYNGYGSDGPLLFVCPGQCSCHD
jgi:hypothetical protein